MSVPAQTQTGPNFRRQGAVIMSVFALIWAMAGASGIDAAASYWVIGAIALAVTAGTIAFALRTSSTRTAPRDLPPDWQRRYNIIGLIEGGAILGAILILVNLDLPGLIPVVVCLIVGIHFLPLAPTFDQPEYRWTALALCIAGAVGAALYGPVSDGTVLVVVGIGAALILWGTALIVARRG